jgi:hypothetical protein
MSITTQNATQNEKQTHPQCGISPQNEKWVSHNHLLLPMVLYLRENRLFFAKQTQDVN